MRSTQPRHAFRATPTLAPGLILRADGAHTLTPPAPPPPKAQHRRRASPMSQLLPLCGLPKGVEKLHRPVRSVVLLGAALLLGGPAALAQPIPIEGFSQWAWEGSIDGGLTWQRDAIVVAETNRDVLVRAFVTFDQPRRAMYFGNAVFDGVITSVETAGVNDVARNITDGGPTYTATGTVSRLGNLLKIDRPDDTMPPGLGPGWALAAQQSPSVPVRVDFGNNIAVFGFTLDLNDQLGDRRIDAVFASGPDRPTVPHLTVWDRTFDGGPLGYYQIINDYRPLTISVIPAPSTPFVAALALGFACRRRRVSVLIGPRASVRP